MVEDNSAPETLLEAWMKSATRFWDSMAKAWTGPLSASETPKPPGGAHESRARESMGSTLRMWQTISSTMIEPGAMDSLFQGINALPEVLTKTAQTGWEKFFAFQRQWFERAGKIGERTEAYKFDNLDQDAFRAWAEIYEEEFRKFLNVPQLGLTRAYQERMGRFTDRFNLFQGAMAQFIYLLYLPMEKSFKVMQERLEALSREKQLPENSQDYYRMWVKILEGHFMTLFKSSEYTQVLGKTLSAMEDFMVAKNEMLQDFVQMLPVPTQKDMDGLYKELYFLKRRVKQLEKSSRQ